MKCKKKILYEVQKKILLRNAKKKLYEKQKKNCMK